MRGRPGVQSQLSELPAFSKAGFLARRGHAWNFETPVAQRTNGFCRSKPTVPLPATPHRQRRARTALCQPLDVSES